MVLFWVAVAALFHTYVVYPMLLLPALARAFGRPVRKDEEALPTVAFVVPVRNEEAVIEAKLRCIFNLDYPADRISVWVGSDCSTDRTHDIVNGFDDPRVHLWIAPERGGKTGVLNRLVPLVAAEIVVFTDANTMHEPDSLRNLVAAFADPDVGGVAGHIEHTIRDSEQLEERLYRSFESRQKCNEALLHSTISAYGGFYAIRRDLFEPIPPNAYSNDDVLIPMNIVRRGYRMWFEESAVSHEDATEDIRQEFQRRVRIGAGNYQSLVWLARFLNPFGGWPAFCYVSHKALRWLVPLLAVVAFAACAVVCFSAWHPLYCLVFGLMLAFVLTAVSAMVVPARLTSSMFYFVAMNFALLGGFARFARGIRSAVWERTDRQT
jgi:cellulose synthase/poly-beta-1,6-N-acetylglucosamine synthase-like glycosyltransferase